MRSRRAGQTPVGPDLINDTLGTETRAGHSKGCPAFSFMNEEILKIIGYIVAGIVAVGLVIMCWPIVVGLLALFGLGALVYAIYRN